MRLPGFGAWNPEGVDADRRAVEEGWGTHGVPAPSGLERAAALRWMKAKGFPDLLILHSSARYTTCGDYLELGQRAEKAGLRVSFLDSESPRFDEAAGKPHSLIVLDHHGGERQLDRLRAAGYRGPVLAPSACSARLASAEGVFVCLRPRKAPAPPTDAFVRAFRERHGAEPTPSAFAGYASCRFALRTLGGYRLLEQDSLHWIQFDFTGFDPWRSFFGEPEICEFRGGIFMPWTSNK
jgi:hypothetical protein